MKETTDYSIFGEIDSNREVDRRHVNRLVKAIMEKNLLHLNPIIVDEYNRVIDGQHRLEAAKALNVPVYYIVDGSVNNSDISALNSNKKNWQMMDYINFHAVEKRPGFNVLCKFLAEHPDIPASAALALLDPDGIRNSKAVMAGQVNVMNLEQAERIAGFLKWLRNFYDYAFNGTVISVIRKMFDHGDFDEAYFRDKIEGQPRSLVKCINARQYREMFLEIYNYKLSVNRIELR